MNFIQKYLDKLSCKHKWEVYNKTDIYGDGFGNMTELPVRREHTLHCTLCGKFKKLKL